MAYSVKCTGESHTLGGSAKHFVTVYADTAADMPTPDPAWAAGSELLIMEDGGTKYRLNNAGEWVESSFDAGGGGNSAGGIPEFRMLETGMQFAHVNLSGLQNVGMPIIGHDAFYAPMGYGTIRRISFDDGSTQDFPAVCPENSQCWITQIAYGNGLYFGVDTQNGMVYQSEDCVNWGVVGDVQIMPQNVTSIWHVNGNFCFACSDNIIGAALKTENYRRVVDYTAMWSNVSTAGTVQAVYEHFGNDFFVTDSGIVSGNLGGGEFRRLAFLEESPDDPYLANTLAFWNDHLVMFEGNLGVLYAMPMRYPYDTRGNFIEPEWYFYRDGSWHEQLSPLGVCSYGENLLVFTNCHVFCIDRNGNIVQLTEEQVNLNDVRRVLAADKAILVCCNTQAYQFFIK